MTAADRAARLICTTDLDRPWFRSALLGGLAVLLMLPVIAGPVRLNDSHWINLAWSEQFTRAVAHGVPWPRWLPLSHGGLGSPVFFFYGPAAFWLAAAFGLCGAATWPALAMAATTALWGSGVAMEWYLRDRAAARPLLGAMLYMALPYHLLDFKMRGALAEFTAYAALPLVAAGVRAAGRGRPALLALGYAVLIATHLPTALLASGFLLPFLMIDAHGADRRALAGCVAGLLLGLGLAAPYLLPALLLQHDASIGTMTGTAALQAARWTMWSHDRHIKVNLAVIGGVAATLLPLALARLPTDRWAAFALALVAVAVGLVPALWTIPPLGKVQFPWRLLAIADFAFAVAAARTSWPMERLALLLAPALIASATVLRVPAPTAPPIPPAALVRHADVIEYLPPELDEETGAYSPRALRLAAASPPVRVAAGRTIVRRFAFPSWQVRCGASPVVATPEPRTRLLSYPGKGCRIERRVTGPELMGWLLAAIAAALLAWDVIARHRRMRAAPRLASDTFKGAGPHAAC